MKLRKQADGRPLLRPRPDPGAFGEPARDRAAPRPGHAPKPAGKKRRNLIIAAIAAGALAIGGSVYWLSQPTYDDIVEGCQKALAAQYKAHGEGKPTACEDVKKDDYDLLVVTATIDDLGWTDSDGNFDENKMLDDATP